MSAAWRDRLGLASHIKPKHLFGFILHSTASVTFLVLLNSAQPSLIPYLSARPSNPGGSEDDPALLQTLGRLNSTLLFFDEAVSIILVLVWGSLAELVGPRSVAVVGYLFVAIGLNIFAVAQNAWPHLLIGRLVFALGASAVTSMLSGLLASFSATAAASPADSGSSFAHSRISIAASPADDEATPLLQGPRAQAPGKAGSGKLASIAGVFTGFGALIAVFGLLRLPPALAEWMDRSHSVVPDSLFWGAKKPSGHRPPAEDHNLLLGLRYTLGLSGALAILIALALRFTLPGTERSMLSETAAAFERADEEEEITPSAAAEAAFQNEGGRRKRRMPTAPFSLNGDDRTIRRQRMRVRMATRAETSFKGRLFALTRGLFQGVMEARKSRTLVTAYIGGAMARATTVGTTAFLPLLVAHYFYTTGVCSDLPDPTLPVSEIKRRCREAFTWTSIISGVAQLTALLLSPFIGFIADAVSPEATMCISAFCGLAGYLLFGFGLPGGIDGDPRSAQGIVAAALIGVCQIGTIICSLALIGKARRLQGFAAGPLAGAYSFFGGIGILAVSSIGAGLFDLYTPSPFIMLAVLAGATALSSGTTWMTIRSR